MAAFLFLLLAVCLPARTEALPEWFIPLREAVYEQKLSADEIAPVYRNVSGMAKSSLSGEEQYLMLSRCEYMMGRAYQFEDRKNEAAVRYSEGINYAQKALEIRESAEGYQMLAENISQSCTVRPVSYAMANGLKVEKYSKNALAIDSKNAAAKIMIAARWVYAPSPFNNHSRGIEMMSAIPNGSNMHKDDEFNVYSAIGYAYMQQKKYIEAGEWLRKSLEIYPTNRYVQTLLAGL
jgi:tetratricopeptide (TPR) repeat protein